MRIRTFLKPLSFLPAICLMYMIYMFSAQDAQMSSQLSTQASKTIVKAVDMVFDMEMDEYHIDYFSGRIEGVTRKLAHMAEYFLLAIAVSFPLYVYGLHGFLLVLLAGGFCVAFACSDEFHQSFVAGRSPQARDVLIDSIGILFGIILVRIIGWTGRKTVFRPQPEDRPVKDKHRKKESVKSSPVRSYDRSIDDQIYYEEAFAGTSRHKRSDAPVHNYGNSQQPYGYHQAPYPEQQHYPNEPYPNQYDPNASYPGYYQNGYQNSYQNNYAPEYDPHSSDELSDDMPFSHLFRSRHDK